MSSSAWPAETRSLKSNSLKKPLPLVLPARPATVPWAACASHFITPSRMKPLKLSPASCGNFTAPAADSSSKTSAQGHFRKRKSPSSSCTSTREVVLSHVEAAGEGFDGRQKDRSTARHAGPADSPDARPGTPARLGHFGAHSPDLQRRAPDSTRFALSRTAPAGAPRLDQSEMGIVREQPQSEILRTYESRPQATPGGRGLLEKAGGGRRQSHRVGLGRPLCSQILYFVFALYFDAKGLNRKWKQNCAFIWSGKLRSTCNPEPLVRKPRVERVSNSAAMNRSRKNTATLAA